MGGAHRPRPEWTVRHWERESPTVRWLRAHPPEGRVYGNARPLVHLFLFDDPARNLDLPPTLEALSERLAEGDYVVLFLETSFGFVPPYGAADIRALPGVRAAAELNDGAVYVLGEE